MLQAGVGSNIRQVKAMEVTRPFDGTEAGAVNAVPAYHWFVWLDL